MDLDIVARVVEDNLPIIQKKVGSLKLKQNYTFIPNWFITEVIEGSVDIAEVAKELITANWGVWSPKPPQQDFIQSQTLHFEDNITYQVVLTRSNLQVKSLYIIKSHKPRYGKSVTEAVIAQHV